MTEFDYPAAHSMDTAWYAVDEAGHVATFWTGENGPLPDHDRPSTELIEQVFMRLLGADPDDIGDWWEVGRGVGIFFYDYNDSLTLEDTVDRYARTVTPDRPLHVDQLPPDLRTEWKRLRVPVRFTEAGFVQPFDYFRCLPYNADAAAYLCADGKTIRPILGRLKAFRNLVADWRENAPDEIAEFTIEEPK
jgi:hypothetical protein